MPSSSSNTRQHRLARHRGPAAEHGGGLVLVRSSRAFSANSGQFEAGSTTTGSSFLPSRPPFLFLLVDEHQHGVLQGRLADRHRAGQGMQNADLDGVVVGERALTGPVAAVSAAATASACPARFTVLSPNASAGRANARQARLMLSDMVFPFLSSRNVSGGRAAGFRRLSATVRAGPGRGHTSIDVGRSANRRTRTAPSRLRRHAAASNLLVGGRHEPIGERNRAMAGRQRILPIRRDYNRWSPTRRSKIMRCASPPRARAAGLRRASPRRRSARSPSSPWRRSAGRSR